MLSRNQSTSTYGTVSACYLGQFLKSHVVTPPTQLCWNWDGFDSWGLNRTNSQNVFVIWPEQKHSTSAALWSALAWERKIQIFRSDSCIMEEWLLSIRGHQPSPPVLGLPLLHFPLSQDSSFHLSLLLPLSYFTLGGKPLEWAFCHSPSLPTFQGLLHHLLGQKLQVLNNNLRRKATRNPSLSLNGNLMGEGKMLRSSLTGGQSLPTLSCLPIIGEVVLFLW